MARKKTPPTIRERVIRYIHTHRLLQPGQTLVVAVSGGPDSICLLHLLHQARGELGMALHVAHLNHQLRGRDSEDDAKYVRALAATMGIPSTIERADVTAYRAEKKLNLEEAAREVRYAFLARTARATGAAAVATGHTRDDHIETILMHILRGAGTAGLAGLHAASQMAVAGEGTPLRVIRPLLETTRDETAAYCGENRLEPRSDVSNLSPEFLRNRVRLELVPQLRRLSPGFDDALERLAAIAADDAAFLEDTARQAWPLVAQERAGAIRLDRQALRNQPPAIQRQLARLAVASLLGNTRDFGHEHIEAMLALIASTAGKSAHLPHGLVLHGEHDHLVLSRSPGEECPLPALAGETPLNIPGETVLPGWRITAQVSRPPVPGATGPYAAALDFEHTGANLVVSPRRPGDRFQPLGLTQPKKLQDFFVDSKAPARCRDRVPLVRSPSEIVWVVGYRIAETARTTTATRQVLALAFERT